MLELTCQLQAAYIAGEAGGEVGVTSETVTVASCFQGDLGTSATIADYIQALGDKICEQQATIDNQQQAIIGILQEIEILKG
jgi:hypothetical protein